MIGRLKSYIHVAAGSAIFIGWWNSLRRAINNLINFALHRHVYSTVYSVLSECLWKKLHRRRLSTWSTWCKVGTKYKSSWEIIVLESVFILDWYCKKEICYVEITQKHITQLTVLRRFRKHFFVMKFSPASFIKYFVKIRGLKWAYVSKY